MSVFFVGTCSSSQHSNHNACSGDSTTVPNSLGVGEMGGGDIFVEMSLQIMKRTLNSVSMRMCPSSAISPPPLPVFSPYFSLVSALSCTYTLLALAGKESDSSM